MLDKARQKTGKKQKNPLISKKRRDLVWNIKKKKRAKRKKRIENRKRKKQ